MAEKQFAAREIVFKEGDTSDEAYVIRQGAIEILKHGDSGEVKLAELAEGEIFGEMGLFDPKSPRSATARAKGETLVDIITETELHEMIAQCPPRIVPIINGVFERLRQTNTRVKSKEQATAILESDVDTIVVSPASEALQETFAPFEMPIAHLPLRIGGYPKDAEAAPNKGTHVCIPCEGPPLLISTTHCEVAIQDGQLYLRDLGSRFGTVVNNTAIGRGKGEYKGSLQKGDNEVILGDKKSPYHIKVSCI
ncbi:MAG: cyclic nucleotide-binding domain-containing protein [Alphaproteobacteria bacterium]|nr:cyclic nucleotide-binding domain-containing protein [Alphaproteobacteria bacterium]